MGFEQACQVNTIPDHTANHGKKPHEAVWPIHKPAHEPHQHMEREGCQRMAFLAVAEEVTDLEGLFDLLEKGTISIQAESHPTQFRKIELKVLKNAAEK